MARTADEELKTKVAALERDFEVNRNEAISDSRIKTNPAIWNDLASDQMRRLIDAAVSITLSYEALIVDQRVF